MTDNGRRYSIVRHYFDAGIRRRVIATGLTLAEAQAHCNDPENQQQHGTRRGSTRPDAQGRAMV